MNRVRLISRKYAAIHNRPDHIARTRKEGERRARMAQQVANAEMLHRDAERQRQLKPPTPMAKAQGRFARVKNFMRRGNR